MNVYLRLPVLDSLVKHMLTFGLQASSESIRFLLSDICRQSLRMVLGILSLFFVN